MRSGLLLYVGLFGTLSACSTAPSATPTASISAANEAPSNVSVTPSASAFAYASASASGIPSAPVVALDPARAKDEQTRAMGCLKDPTCSLAEAEKLFVSALDHGSTDSCELFYRGAILTKDWPRARACFERRFQAASCDGSSPSADRLTLATMYLDGQGGPKAPERAGALFVNCYEDVSAKWLQDEIAGRPEGGPPVDFCRDVGGTTLTMNECSSASLDEAHLERDVALKGLAARGTTALQRETGVAQLFSAYIQADVAAQVFPVQMGSIAPLVSNGAEHANLVDYAAWIRAVAEGRALLDEAARIEAEKQEAEALAAALTNANDPAWRALITRAEAAYTRFVNAAVDAEGIVLGEAGKVDAKARLARARRERLKALLSD